MNRVKSVEREQEFHLRSWLLTIAVLLVALFAVLFFVNPGMPDRIELLTGPRGGAYYEFGERIAEDLRKRGLQVQVVATRGAGDNLNRLAESRNRVALEPAISNWDNIADQATVNELVTFGNIGFEPIWLFGRNGLQIDEISDLNGQTLVCESEGTVSAFIARQLIKINKLENKVKLLNIDGLDADKLLNGFQNQTIDAGLITGNEASQIVQALFHSTDATYISLRRSAAIAARVPGLTYVQAPAGVFNLSKNIPITDSPMLATTTCLVANDAIHPAIAPMMLRTVERVRKTDSLFATTIQFPNDRNLGLPLDASAKRYFQQGETWLSQYMNYRTQRLVSHLGFVVLPIFAVAVFLLKFVPIGFRVWNEFRLTGLFRQLESVEKGNAAGDDPTELLDLLDQIDQESSNMRVPRSRAHDFIDFRQFLHDIRERVKNRLSASD